MYSPERDRIFDFSQAHTVHHHVAVGRGDDPAAMQDFLETDIFQVGEILNRRCLADAVKIDVKEGMASRIFIDDSIGGAGDIVIRRDIESRCQPLDKGGFTASEIPA